MCVTLYNSGWHYCVRVIINWFTVLMRHEQMAPEVARPAIEALENAVKQGGKTLPGDAAAIAALDRFTDRIIRGKEDDWG